MKKTFTHTSVSLQVTGMIPVGHMGDPEGECRGGLNEEIPRSVVSERVSPGLVVGGGMILVGGYFGSVRVSRILPSPHHSRRCGRCGRVLGI